MVSIEPQRWLLEQLVDSGVQVDVLLSRGSDPETVELTMTQRVAADDAEAYFATGLLPFEERVRESVRGLYYDTSDSVALIYGTHDHAAGSDDGHAHSHAEPPTRMCGHHRAVWQPWRTLWRAGWKIQVQEAL